MFMEISVKGVKALTEGLHRLRGARGGVFLLRKWGMKKRDWSIAKTGIYTEGASFRERQA